MHRLLVLALLVSAVVWSSATFCELGGDFVCTDDGLTLANECIARVQGYTSFEKGKCTCGEDSKEEGSSSGLCDPGLYIDESLRITEGEISYDDIKEYLKYGLVFQGAFNFDGTFKPEDDSYSHGRRLQELGAVQSRNLLAPGLYLRATAFSKNQRCYANQGSRGFGRRRLQSELGIIGKDDRASAPHSKPYSAAVGIYYKVGDEDVLGCTATFISENALLTNAKCVYDRTAQGYYQYDSYYFKDADGSRLDANIEFTFIPGSYSFDDENYEANDLAVILLDKSFPSLGYLDIDALCYKPSRLTLLGYGKSHRSRRSLLHSGVELYKSTCPVSESVSCDNDLLSHTCDGTSTSNGGPMITHDYVVRAVKTQSGKDSNEAIALTPASIGFIKGAASTPVSP